MMKDGSPRIMSGAGCEAPGSRPVQAAKTRRKWVLFVILMVVAFGVSEVLDLLVGHRTDFLAGWVGAIYAYEVGLFVPTRLRVFAASREPSASPPEKP